ncbi:MAG: outer membrane lipoprotein-sorting protein [Candidatus Methylacidiphilales bacterium]
MKRFLLLVCGLFFGVASLSAAPDPKKKIPEPEVVQLAVWDNMRLQDFTLRGVLRTEKSIHPITLRTLGRKMVYEFQKQPLQIRVQLTPSGSIVDRRAGDNDKWTMVSGKGRLETILDSDIAYEDLGVDFLRWSRVTPLGGDSIKTLEAWAYEAQPPSLSNYTKARFWISSDFLSVLRVDAYNDQNQVIKRVEVNGVMQVGDVYVIKEMMIASLIPGRELSRSRSFITIQKAEPGSGLQLID